MDGKMSQRVDPCSALAAVPTPVMAVDKDLNVIYMNPSGLKLLGMRSEDVVGKRCADLVRTPACDTEKCLARRCLREGREFSGDTVAHLPGGDVPIRAAGAVMKDKDGNMVGFVEHLMDVSKEVEITKEVKRLTSESKKGVFSARADESRFEGNYRSIVQALNQTMDVVVDKVYWYEQILDSLPYPISVTDLDMSTTFINRASENVLKRSRADMMGRPCKEWKGPICGTKECGIIKMRESGIPRTHTGRGGKHTQIDVAYIKNAKGEPIGHIEVLQDVTAQQRVALYQRQEVERVAHNLKQLADGNLELDVKVEEADEYTKETSENFMKINASLAQVVEAISNLTTDARSLTDAAVEGKLNVRVDANKHKGEYLAIVKGMNDTMDAVVNPLRVAAAYFKKIAAGDIPKQITREYMGDFNDIKESLNLCITAIGALIQDVDKLSAAGVGGELSVRADASKHKGSYAKIVQGMNDTLDAVVRPLEEAMRVADAYSQGDMTARVEIEAKGDMLRFSNSLDMIGESLTELLTEVNRSVDMVQGTSQDLASSAEEMNASTEQVSSAIQQISKGAQNQAAAVEETAKVMAEISSSTEKVVGNVGVATEGAKRSSESAKKGKATVETTVNKMREVEKVVMESASVIEALGKRSEEIGEIVDVITNISDQTNLLALNAAIEAARAGDQGRGFAVVAEEVKNLAEDSREAAERIAKMIKEVQNETSKAVEAMKRGTKETAEGLQMVDATGMAFEDISSLASKVDETLSGLAGVMGHQKDGTLRAAKAVDGIASIAEETASASEESASSTEELTASMEDMTARAQTLAELASKLKEMSSRFKVGDEAEAEERAAKPALKPSAPKVAAKKAEVKVPSRVKETLSKRGIEVGT